MNQTQYQTYLTKIQELRAGLENEQKTRDLSLALTHLEDMTHRIRDHFEEGNRDVISQLQRQLTSSNQIIWILLGRMGGEIAISQAELEEAANPSHEIIREPHPEDNTLVLKSTTKT